MKNYSLTLVGVRPESLDVAHSSAEMLYAGLENEFKQLGHVKLNLLSLTDDSEENPMKFINSIPPSDFLLIRIFGGHPILKYLKNANIKHEICSFLEHGQKYADHSFAFLDYNEPGTVIPFPYINKYMQNIKKIPNTILIDDDYGMKGSGSDLCPYYAKWLYPLKDDCKIYQLTHKETAADWIKPIKMSGYKRYMEATSQIETFLQSHAGSYEHSVIDMVARGIRTIIPKIDNKTRYLPEESIIKLELPTFSSGKELRELLTQPVDTELWDSKINKMTEMKEVVRIIDAHFQGVLNEKF